MPWDINDVFESWYEVCEEGGFGEGREERGGGAEEFLGCAEFFRLSDGDGCIACVVYVVPMP